MKHNLTSLFSHEFSQPKRKRVRFSPKTGILDHGIIGDDAIDDFINKSISPPYALPWSGFLEIKAIFALDIM